MAGAPRRTRSSRTSTARRSSPSRARLPLGPRTSPGESEHGLVPIGDAAPGHAALWSRTTHLREVAPGEVGELLVSGPQVVARLPARHPERTAARVRRPPPGRRTIHYRTGRPGPAPALNPEPPHLPRPHRPPGPDLQGSDRARRDRSRDPRGNPAWTRWWRWDGRSPPPAPAASRRSWEILRPMPKSSGAASRNASPARWLREGSRPGGAPPQRQRKVRQKGADPDARAASKRRRRPRGGPWLCPQRSSTSSFEPCATDHTGSSRQFRPARVRCDRLGWDSSS